MIETNKEHYGALIVAFYNLGVAAVLIIVSIPLVGVMINHGVSSPIFILGSLVFDGFNIICISAALKYLERKEKGRVHLIICSVLQVIICAVFMIAFFKIETLIIIPFLLLSVWSLRYLTSLESRNWVLGNESQVA